MTSARGELARDALNEANLKAIKCPVYLLAGESDNITSKEQVFDAEKYLGTPKTRIEKKLVPSGHIRLLPINPRTGGRFSAPEVVDREVRDVCGAGAII